MPRRKPPPLLRAQRSSDNDKRRLRNPIPAASWLQNLSSRARFEGYAKHKLQPHAFGLATFTGWREDATYCDGHADFSPADMPRVPRLLRRGIEAGLVGDNNDNHGDPTLLWSVDDNGWIYESRLTVPGQALYHGYPVLPSEAIARAVIARYVDYVYEHNIVPLMSTAQRVQRRYS